MRVDLKLNISNGRLTGGHVTVYRDGGPKIYSDSAFWHAVKRELQKQGHDVIKKLMWKDGHMVDDNQYYVRSRKYTPTSFMLSQTDFAIRSVYDDYNKEGKATFFAIDASMEDEAAEEVLAKRKTRYSTGSRSSKSKRAGTAGLGRIG